MEEFKTLFQYPPKNAWNAVLVQLFCWCFRRFCVERLTVNDGTISELWDSLFILTTDYAPLQIQPHLDQWLTPEHTENVSNLTELDRALRSIIIKLDTSISTDDLDTQDKISTFFDEEMSKLLEQWIGSVYAPFSLFPTPTDSDTEINITKLNAIVYLLGRQPSLQRTIRRTFRSKRVVTPIKTQLRKTRRLKQNGEIQLLVKSDARNNDSRGPQSEKDNSQGEKREGNEEHTSEAQRDTQGQDSSANKEGGSEHPQPPVHAEPVQQHSSTGEHTEDHALKT
jgi:hypothetical protein